jgi:hypothetical protein
MGAGSKASGTDREVSGPDRPDWLVPEGKTSAPDPEFTCEGDTLTVTFRSLDVARDHYGRHIQGGGLLVPGAQWGWTISTQLTVRLELPDDLTVHCTAEIVAVLPTGFGLAIQVSKADMRRLKVTLK